MQEIYGMVKSSTSLKFGSLTKTETMKDSNVVK
jgi:hypothetical protein